MNIGTIEKDTNPWQYMCERWNMFAPPGRPSKGDVKNYQELLYKSFEGKEQRRHNVLILGSTPEIRDMLALDEDINVVLVDITIDMILSMTQLMENKNDSEVWVKSNWLSVPLQDSYFDAIISDLVICNVDRKNHGTFFDKLLKMLKPDGHWINRVYFVDGNTEIRPLDILLDEYSKKAQITKEDINNFRSTAGLIGWNKEEKLLDWSLLYKEMKRYIKDGRYCHPNPKANEILEGVYELFKPFDKKYFLDTEEGNDQVFSEYFKINGRLQDKSVIDLKEKAYYIYDLIRK